MFTQARINSLKGNFDNIEIIALPDNTRNYYTVKYKNKICSAIFNPFNNCLYADDIYGIIEPPFEITDKEIKEI